MSHHTQCEKLRQTRYLMVKSGPHASKPAQLADRTEWKDDNKDTRLLVLEDDWYIPSGQTFTANIYDIVETTTIRSPSKVWKVMLLCMTPEVAKDAQETMNGWYGFMAPGGGHMWKIGQIVSKYPETAKMEWARRYYNAEVLLSDTQEVPFDRALLKE